MRDLSKIKFRSEFRAGTGKVFTNSDVKMAHKNLSNLELIKAAALAAFADEEGIDQLESDVQGFSGLPNATFAV